MYQLWQPVKYIQVAFFFCYWTNHVGYLSPNILKHRCQFNHWHSDKIGRFLTEYFEFFLIFAGLSSSREMGEIEGSYRVLPPGTRLGAQYSAGVSTLEPGHSLGGNIITGNRNLGKTLQIRVHGLDDSQEFFDVDVSLVPLPNKSAVCHTTSDITSYWHIYHWLREPGLVTAVL